MRTSCSGALLLGGIALAACGDGAEERRTLQPAVADDSAAETEPTMMAGGETSEFSGGNLLYCPDAGATILPLDLTSEALAAWIALIPGAHDTTLEWQPGIVADAGSEPVASTRLQLDIDLLRAQDVVFDGANLGYEGEGCNGKRERQILLAISLHTDDGALSGYFEHWVSPVEDALAEPRLVTTSKRDNGRYPLAGFTSPGGLALAAGAELRFGLELTADRLRGVLMFALARARGEPQGVKGAFPNYDCLPRIPIVSWPEPACE